MKLAALTLTFALALQACAPTDAQAPPIDPSSVIHKAAAGTTNPPPAPLVNGVGPPQEGEVNIAELAFFNI